MYKKREKKLLLRIFYTKACYVNNERETPLYRHILQQLSGKEKQENYKKITFYDKGEITSAVMAEVKNHDLGYLPLVITFKLLSSLWAKIKMRTTHGL